jgi:hypothetical protein
MIPDRSSEPWASDDWWPERRYVQQNERVAFEALILTAVDEGRACARRAVRDAL